MNNAELDAVAVASDQRQGERMMATVHKFLGRFVAYPSEHAQVAHALWIVHTHLMDRWESTPRIAFLSPEPASGKTRALEVTELLVPNPVAAVNVSPAYLFRKVGCEEGATILFDEIDTIFGPKAKDNEEIRGLLNAGHRRGAVAGRCVVHGKTVMTEEIPAYAAVALAGLGWLPDTLLSRSIIVRMRRRAPGETVEPFRRRIHSPQAAPVYSALEIWARGVPDIVWPELPPEIQDRDADVWESLIAIADIVGGSWPERARKAAVALVAASKDAEPSLGIRLLADTQTVFGDLESLATKSLLRELTGLEESPWGDLRGKPLDERGLARRLRQYGIKSANIRIGDNIVKGYRRSDLFDAWSRYLPPSPSNSATSATVLEFQRPSVADDVAGIGSASATENASKSGLVAAVADVADLAGSRGEGQACAHCGKPGTDAIPLLLCSLAGDELHLHADCIERKRR